MIHSERFTLIQKLLVCTCSSYYSVYLQFRNNCIIIPDFGIGSRIDSQRCMINCDSLGNSKNAILNSHVIRNLMLNRGRKSSMNFGFYLAHLNCCCPNFRCIEWSLKFIQQIHWRGEVNHSIERYISIYTCDRVGIVPAIQDYFWVTRGRSSCQYWRYRSLQIASFAVESRTLSTCTKRWSIYVYPLLAAAMEQRETPRASISGRL